MSDVPTPDALTRDEFELRYAERSGVTVEWLREHGRIVRPCACGDPDCEGWQSVSRELAAANDRDVPGWSGDERHPDPANGDLTAGAWVDAQTVAIDRFKRLYASQAAGSARAQALILSVTGHGDPGKLTETSRKVLRAFDAWLGSLGIGFEAFLDLLAADFNQRAQQAPDVLDRSLIEEIGKHLALAALAVYARTK